MLNAIFRPLEKWPGEPTPSYARSRGPFQADYRSTLDLLEHELDAIHAKNITLLAQFRRDQIRNDGWPKGDAAPNGPAVILTFTGSDGAQYSYPCDTFNTWTANLRAIALSLESLRRVDRYGVTKRGEQYQGFRALPEPEKASPKMTPIEAAAFIAKTFPGVSPDVLLTTKTWFEFAFREAQKISHPDIGGSHDDFVKLQEAGAVLKEHFGGKGAGV